MYSTPRCAVTDLVQQCWARDRPVLIGTTTVNESEQVLQVLQQWTSRIYKDKMQRIQVLNAKPENVRTEAQVRNWERACVLGFMPHWATNA